MADAKFQNLERVLARLSAIAPAVRKALADQLKTEADDLAEAIRRAMEVAYADSGDHDHERLKDSVKAIPNAHRAISYFILANARDAKGEPIGAHVEQGHRDRNGKHVAGRPAFWPTYRARKAGIKRRLSKAGRTATKAAFRG